MTHDTYVVGNSARFLNHSCDPNAYSKHMTIDGNKKIIFLALRDIERGEEITCALAVQRTTWHYDLEWRG